MKLTSYYQSGQQVTNILLAREKATVQSQLNKQKRIYDYNTKFLLNRNGEVKQHYKPNMDYAIIE